MSTSQASSAPRKYGFSGASWQSGRGAPQSWSNDPGGGLPFDAILFPRCLGTGIGTKKSDDLFYRAGHLADQQFYDHAIGPVHDLGTFVKKLQTTLRDMGIGIPRIEEEDLAHDRLVLTVSGDLDCSGLPELSYEVCTYDEGFIAALLESFSGKKFQVKEVDCRCTSDRTCRFQATMATSQDVA